MAKKKVKASVNLAKDTEVKQAKDMTSEDLGLSLNELYGQLANVRASINNINMELRKRQKQE